MIAYLRGHVLRRDNSGQIVIDVSGVGYNVLIPTNLLQSINPEQEVELWIHSHIREDGFSLFGFFNEKEKEVFTTMISINGLGPKTAIGILSSCSSQELMQWIETEDIQALSKLPKIGKKTAQQMILSLKGKWPQFKLIKQDPVITVVSHKITKALSNLGFKSMEIKEALSQIEVTEDMELKDGIKKALAFLHQV